MIPLLATFKLVTQSLVWIQDVKCITVNGMSRGHVEVTRKKPGK